MIPADLFAYIGGIAAMVSFIPQLLKAWTSRSTEDISWTMLVVTLISATGYEIYSLALGLLPVAIMNGVFALTIVGLMGLKFKFDREAGPVSAGKP
jgi:MtN3 and saliva related transmembrane protein